MIQLFQKHTAKNIKEEILKHLKIYSISLDQIYSSTTDNGSNVLKDIRILQEEQDELLSEVTFDLPNDYQEEIDSSIASVLSVVRCAAHTIQLAAYDVIKELEDEIVKCRKNVKKIRKIIPKTGTQLKKPVLDNATRWNSTYEMMKSLMNLKDDLLVIDNLNTLNWEFVKNFVTAFQPLAKCTKNLQTEQYVIGDFYRDWLNCELHLKTQFTETPYAKKLYNAMEKRKQKLLENDALNAALYLDNRFNYENSMLLSEDQKKKALIHLLKTYDMIKKLENSQEPLSQSSTVSIDSPTSHIDETPSSLTEQYSMLELHMSMELSEIQRSIKQKLLLLSHNKKLPFHTDVIKHWKYNNHDEDLKKLAEVCLAVPATQVSVERAFSALALMLTKWRSNLKSTTINNLLITKLNFYEIASKPVELQISSDVD